MAIFGRSFLLRSIKVMKKCFAWTLLAAGIIFGLTVNGFAASSNPKIGYFDANSVAAQSLWGKKVIEDLKREQERLSNALDEKGKTFKAAKDEYDKKRDVMDEKTRNRKQKELQDMAMELEKLANESSQKFNKDAADAKAPLFEKIGEIVRKIGKDEKYDFIFEKGSLHFASEKDDLTKRIISELDKSSPK